MNLLAIDTSMQACSAAVLCGPHNAQTFCAYEEIERGHAERLMAMIDEVLAKARLDIKQIDRFAVCRGPGTFTGVRIGIATARGLALACNKPLIGIGTLEVLARRVLHERRRVANEPARQLAIAIDARRGEIYWQFFDHHGQPQSEPIALAPQKAASLVKQQQKPVMLAGSGADLVAQFLDRNKQVFACSHPNLQPDAARLGELAATMEASEQASAAPISPLYLRPADAKVQSGYAIAQQAGPVPDNTGTGS